MLSRRPTSKKRAPAHSALRIACGALAAVAVLVLGLLFAPTKLGGSVDYAVVSGVSMQPRLHAGDLAVVRRAESYHIGEIVAYHNAQLGRVVLHRIVARDGARFVFQGDNNDYVDPDEPTRSELIGRLWFRVPRAGSVVLWLDRQNRGMFALALVPLVAFPGAGVRRRRRRARRPEAARRVPAMAERTLLSVGVSGLLLFGLVALLGYSRELSHVVAVPGAYFQNGTYAYSARTSPSSVYPSGTIATGQTLFSRLVDRARISFGYRFSSAFPHSVTGRARLGAVLTSSEGWRLPLPAASQPIRAGRVTLTLPLSLRSLDRTMTEYRTATGVPAPGFTLTVTPRVQVQGVVDGQVVHDAFAPQPLQFALDADSLRLQQASAPQQPSPSGVSAADPLHPNAAGALSRTAPRSVQIAGHALRISTLRKAGASGVLASLLVLAAALAAGLAVSRDELTAARRRYANAIVPISSPPTPPWGGFVDVATFDSLARLATGYERVILHERHDDADSFYVDDDGTVYRYRAPKRAAASVR